MKTAPEQKPRQSPWFSTVTIVLVPILIGLLAALVIPLHVH